MTIIKENKMGKTWRRQCSKFFGNKPEINLHAKTYFFPLYHRCTVSLFFQLFYLWAVSGSLPSKIRRQQTSNLPVKSQMTEALQILGT